MTRHEDRATETCYAINVADLTRLHGEAPWLSTTLIAPALDKGTIVNAEPDRVDGMAALLRVPEERARAIAAILHGGVGSSQRWHPRKMRIYKSTDMQRWTLVDGREL